jgi:hypothetical protein
MTTAWLIGTGKGLLVAKSEDRKRWAFGDLALKDWKVTAAARDAGGRF